MTSLQRPFKDKRVLPAIGLVSLSLVASEMVWTRIFSAELFYTFAFLTLSIAVMGLGLGALSLRLSPRLPTPNAIAGLLVVSAVVAAIGPALVIALGLEFSQLLFSPGMLAKFLLAILILGLPYFCAGAALASLFLITRRNLKQKNIGKVLGKMPNIE